MNNYPADLELRRRVAEAYIKGTDWEGNEAWVKGWCTGFEPDCSFGEVLLLVRELDEKEFMALMRCLRDICAVTHSLDYFPVWLVKHATPADYCRAYLSAKGEENGTV